MPPKVKGARARALGMPLPGRVLYIELDAHLTLAPLSTAVAMTEAAYVGARRGVTRREHTLRLGENTLSSRHQGEKGKKKAGAV